MRPLTVIIPTYNEEENLQELLPLVQWANEVIVVDSYSEDRTVAVAKAHNCTVWQNTYEGPAPQKNWAIPQARHEWVFMLDADERPTLELTKEIQAFLASTREDIDAFWIGRQSFFMDKQIRYSGWQGDKVVRLFRKSCRYNDKRVHEEIETSGKRIGQLQYKLEHYTYKDLDHFLDKLRRYARWSALDYASKTPKVTLFHLWGKPFFRFFKHYIIQRGFLDGRAGFVVCALMAWGVFLRYAYLKEMLLNKQD